MPIDPNIALQVRPMELADPLQQYGRAVQLRSLIGQGDLQALQMQEARRSAEETRAYNEAYKGALNPDGTIDRPRLTSALAGGGLGSRLPGVMEQFAKADKLGLETKELQGKVDAQGLTRARDQFKALNNGLGALMRKPDLSHQDVIQTVGGLAAQGLITPEQGQEAIRQMPGNPAALQQFLQRRLTMNVEADKMIELMLPKLQQVNDGQRTQFVDTNPMSNPGGPAPIQMQATPDAVMRDGTTRAEGAANRGVSIRGQNMADSRSREGMALQRDAAAAGRWQNDLESGSQVNLATGERRPITDGGAPVGPRPKDMTDAQAKALLFGTRAADAERTLVQRAGAGTDRPGAIKATAETVAGLVPFAGEKLSPVAGTMTNWTQSNAQQSVERAQRDFINAILRRESGAVISPQEFENARLQYFPSPNDGPDVRAEKTRARQLAIQGIMAEVPERARTMSPAAAGPQSGGARPPLSAFEGGR